MGCAGAPPPSFRHAVERLDRGQGLASRGLQLTSIGATTKPNAREIALKSRPRIAGGNGTNIAIRTH